MNEKIKNWLGAAAVLTLFLFGISAVGYVHYYSKSVQPASFRSFSVSADGKSVSVPDVAQYTFSVISEGGKSIADLEKDNHDKVNAIIAFLKKGGVDSKDIQTQVYSVEPRYQYSQCGYVQSEKPVVCPPPSIVGYTIRQTVLVKARDFAKVGDLLSGTVSQGANEVSQLSFTLDDPTSVQDAARAEAITKAQKKAESIAEAGHFKLGRLLSISEGGSSPYPMPYMNLKSADFGRAEAAVAAPSIEPGSQEVQVTVSLQYEIE